MTCKHNCNRYLINFPLNSIFLFHSLFLFSMKGFILVSVLSDSFCDLSEIIFSFDFHLVLQCFTVWLVKAKDLHVLSKAEFLLVCDKLVTSSLKPCSAILILQANDDLFKKWGLFDLFKIESERLEIHVGSDECNRNLNTVSILFIYLTKNYAVHTSQP